MHNNCRSEKDIRWSNTFFCPTNCSDNGARYMTVHVLFILCVAKNLLVKIYYKKSLRYKARLVYKEDCIYIRI